MKVISPSEARAQGLTRYYTGRPCLRGHIDERLVSNSTCAECNRTRVKAQKKTPRGYQQNLDRQARYLRTPKGQDSVRRKHQRYHSSERGVAHRKHRYDTDIQYRIKNILRSRLRMAILHKSKRGSAIGDLGCSIEKFIAHIESQWQPGWTWDRGSWGKIWHIDHIQPLATFDLTDQAQFRRAVHFSNLRPYPASLNISEGWRIRETRRNAQRKAA